MAAPPSSFTWRAPTRVVFGAGKLSVLGPETAALGARALLVTDAGLAGSGDLVGRATGSMREADVEVEVFSGITGEPTEAAVLAGVERMRAMRPDLLVAIGGGSAIDTAKAMALVHAKGGSPLDWAAGSAALEDGLLPIIAVPTTAGTGAETSIGAVVGDPDSRRKLVLAHWAFLPRVAILDPELTVGLPAALTAATGMDAYAHAIDVLHARRRIPFNDALAFHAVATVHRHLRRAVRQPDDIEARGEMLAAACSMGFALSTSPYGIIHALGHPLGARYKVHHGRCVALLAPHGMRWNLPFAEGVYAETARRTGIASWDAPDAVAAGALIAATEELLLDLELPRRLGEVGVDAGGLAGMAADAMLDLGARYNTRQPANPEELEAVYRGAL